MNLTVIALFQPSDTQQSIGAHFSRNDSLQIHNDQIQSQNQLELNGDSERKQEAEEGEEGEED